MEFTVDVFQIGCFSAAAGAVVDDFNLNQFMFEVNERH
jgi:hypothetical protein